MATIQVAKPNKVLREVSNEEFELAWRDYNNRRIVYYIAWKAAKKFQYSIVRYEDLISQAMLGLRDALRYHDYDHKSKRKFTSSVMYFAWRRCMAEGKSLTKAHYRNGIPFSDVNEDGQVDSICEPKRADCRHAIEMMGRLKPDVKGALYKYYVENKTLHEVAAEEGISHEGVRFRIKKGLKQLKALMVA